ncbi:uncharacterized protein LOC111343109 isoform X2 [Stylophora pistillata]|uniref:uncharacterized protein LOC111343109 isoform X2 n=1 Tax=Stylophora pistillata TaxID=50429 RepID=UPI000C0468BC|nr:uncharacterized protein LOC111343109 isoform X2 [Stylophora pistillata]
MAVLGNDKRWLVTLAALNKVLAPVLRAIVKQGMDYFYEFVDNHLNGLLTPCSLKTLTKTDVCHLAATPSLASALKDLNFGNINNNSGKNKAACNCTVNSSVDLAKLYLPNYLAKFSAFDKSMDLSAALNLLGYRKYRSQIFLSSDPLHNIQSMADDVRENVRNPASHFDESHWSQIVFDQCFDKIKALVQCLPLNAVKEKELLDQLSEWKTIGFQLIVDEDVKDLMEQFQNDKPTRDEIEKIMEKHSTRNRTFFSERMDTFQNVVLSELQGNSATDF